MGALGLKLRRLHIPRWLSIITGLDCWNEVLEWTTGLTFFGLKIIFMLSNTSQLPVYQEWYIPVEQANSKRMM